MNNKFLWSGIAFAGLLCLMFLCWIGYRLVSPDLPGIEGPRLSYAEFVSILLTLVTIMLGILGLVIAGLAIWGYSGITKQSSTTAKSAAECAIPAYFASDEGKKLLAGLIQPRVDSEVRSAMEAASLPAAFAPGADLTDGELFTEPIGEEYPGDRRADNEQGNPDAAS